MVTLDSPQNMQPPSPLTQRFPPPILSQPDYFYSINSSSVCLPSHVASQTVETTSNHQILLKQRRVMMKKHTRKNKTMQCTVVITPDIVFNLESESEICRANVNCKYCIQPEELQRDWLVSRALHNQSHTHISIQRGLLRGGI